MFTEKVLLRNSSNNVLEKLHRISIWDRPGTLIYESKYAFIIADEKEYKTIDNENDNLQKFIDKGYYDCENNVELFLALSALRDDHDKNQWFVNNDNGEWVFCAYNEFHYYVLIDPVNINSTVDIKDKFHKATKRELIDHFIY